MNNNQQLLQEMLIPASQQWRTPGVENVAVCQAGCSGKCVSVKDQEALPQDFYA